MVLTLGTAIFGAIATLLAVGGTATILSSFDKNKIGGQIKSNGNNNSQPPVNEEKKEPIVVPPSGTSGTSESTIKDETDKNEELNINGVDFQSAIDSAYKMRQEQWAREDQIRKETQYREDTAYQRAIEDMQKAGINPNLMNVTPADSGGGITSASQIDMTLYEGELEKYIKELEQEFEKNFQGNENDKDRIMKLIQNLVTLIGIGAMARK